MSGYFSIGVDSIIMGCYLMFPGVVMYLFNTNYHMNNYFIPYLKKTDTNAYTNITGADFKDDDE